jgi:chemotaxis protein methyltransferase CheR
MEIEPADFELVRDLVCERTGVVLEPGKEYLIESRLTALAKRQQIESIAAILQRVRRFPMDPLTQQVVEAMLTHETSFFRDLHPFTALAKVVLPDLLRRRAASRTLSIWCAASSSGQEPYSLAITLAESAPDLQQWKLCFIASDVSGAMIEKARTGRYTQLEVNRGLPAALLVKYFTKRGVEWELRKELREWVEFRRMNLKEPLTGLPPMDLIFMRNVLIYFSLPTKREILGRVRQALKSDGYLFLGGAETALNIDESFERMEIEQGGCYRPRAKAA